MKNIVIGLIVLGYLTACESKEKRTFEIYTNYDIIYIDDLTVSFESNSKVIKFKSQQSLKKYISEFTANQVDLSINN